MLRVWIWKYVWQAEERMFLDKTHRVPAISTGTVLAKPAFIKHRQRGPISKPTSGCKRQTFPLGPLPSHPEPRGVRVLLVRICSSPPVTCAFLQPEPRTTTVLDLFSLKTHFTNVYCVSTEKEIPYEWGRTFTAPRPLREAPSASTRMAHSPFPSVHVYTNARSPLSPDARGHPCGRITKPLTQDAYAVRSGKARREDDKLKEPPSHARVAPGPGLPPRPPAATPLAERSRCREQTRLLSCSPDTNPAERSRSA